MKHPVYELPRKHLPLTPVDNEGIGSKVQTLRVPELMFRASLQQDGAQHLELART